MDGKQSFVKIDMDAPLDLRDEALKPRFTLLPDGDYLFRVKSCSRDTIQRGNYAGTGMIRLTLAIKGEDYEHEVRDFLIFADKFIDKVKFFWRAILPDSKDGFIPRWDDIPGMHGRCKIVTDTYKNKKDEDVKVNKVKTYYRYDKEKIANESYGYERVPDEDVRNDDDLVDF